MNELLIILAIAAGVWFISQHFGKAGFARKAFQIVLFDTYRYIGNPPVELKDFDWSKPAKTLLPEIQEAIIETTVAHHTRIVLGERMADVSAGIALEEEVAAFEKEIATTAQYKTWKRNKTRIEAELNAYAEIGEYLFAVPLSDRERLKHTYVIGKSGSGKSVLLTWMVKQDIRKGRGLCFLSPERETIEEDILPFLPEERLDDVIYFNPSDENLRYSMNPLHLAAGEETEFKVDEVFTTIARLLEGELSPRMSQLLSHTIYTLVELPDTTLLDVGRLLDRDDKTFRMYAAQRITNPESKRFWLSEYESLPRSAHLPITSRISRFTRSKRIRNVLCRTEAGLDFRHIMDSGKILLANLSDGLLGEQASALLGAMLISKLQLATMSRANVPESKRRPFFTYVDEFQTFTGTSNVSFEKILARARKYHLPLILAHQQTGQIPPSLLKEILGNVSTVVCFNVSSDDAQRFSREFIMPDGKRAAPEDLVTQAAGETFTKVGNHSFKMRTLLIKEEPNTEIVDRVVQQSRLQETEETKPPPGGEIDATEDIDPTDPFE